MMRELSIDIETYSSADLNKSGVYAYASAPDFTILLFAYALDDGEVSILDLASGEAIPDEIMLDLTSPDTVKTAFNANFERTCLSKYFGIPMPPEQWRCTMVQAMELGLPGSLAGAAQALGLPEQKDAQGRACINYFSKPCKPTKANGNRVRNLPQHDPEKWEIFKSYCKQDVVVEREIKNKLRSFPIPPSEQKLWECDQRINDRGIGVDLTTVKNAVMFSERHKQQCLEEAIRLTGIDNPNSVTQLKNWIENRTDDTLESLDKKAVGALLDSTSDLLLKRVLELKKAMSKTSNKKYDAMLEAVCADGKIRGTMQFYGANRTGRWGGRIVQPQNLPQNHLNDLEAARNIVRDGDYELFEMLYDIPSTLSELIRTALVPSEGRRFIVSDFSAIEARVIAYLAQESWRLKVFEDGGDIYCASASQMFGVPVVKHGVNGHLRQKGKIAELALGYGGSVSALTSMGALEMGLSEDELPPLVDAWRSSNLNITAFWKECQDAAMSAINDKPKKIKCGITFYKKSGILFIGLPSGRALAYAKPQIGTNRFGSPSITYMGVKNRGAWERVETWGGKLVENIVQAFARDCLAESMLRLEKRGFEINFHVHDEVILDVPTGVSSAKEIADIMGEPIEWAQGLKLKAEAYETPFYRKD